jgi:hypothetical protein
MADSCSMPEADEAIQDYTEVERVARKEHKCCECGATIKPGDKYQHVSGFMSDGPVSYRTCSLCVKVLRDFFPDCQRTFETLWESMRECHGIGSPYEVPQDE